MESIQNKEEIKKTTDSFRKYLYYRQACQWYQRRRVSPLES